jgi:hypothetical protein
MLEKKFKNSPKILDLFPVSDKKIELSYPGEQISSNGGSLFLHDVENQIRLFEGICSSIGYRCVKK